MRRALWLLIFVLLFSSCASKAPYVGKNPTNTQFERGMSFPPLDFFGQLISLPFDLLFWTIKYGNHNISVETEERLAQFIQYYELKDVKIRINQWAPHKEIGRLLINPHIGWPYKILFFPSTLITSLLGRPFSGLLISDYYDPGSNTIHIFSDEIPIVLHEAGHARDFATQEYKGTYALARLFPGVNLIQEGVATEEAVIYLEQHQHYDDLLRSYKILYPAYATYAISYLSAAPAAIIGAVTFGHFLGRFKAKEKKWQLVVEKKLPEFQTNVVLSQV